MSSSVMAMPQNIMKKESKDQAHAIELRLLKEALKGNRDAFGDLVMRYRGQSLRIAVSMTGDIETARDLTQEAFIKAYRALGTFDTQAPFLPWYYQILRNVCRDYLRGRNRFRNMVDRFKSKPTRRANLIDDVQRDDLVMKVRTAVSKLKPRDREIIELKHLAGFDYREISDMLRIPKGTVMSRLFYARKALKELLQDDIDFIRGEDS